MAEDTDKKIAFFYQNSPLSRTVHADGAWAGLTPQLEIQFSFFNDLRPTPEYILHRLTDQGLGEEVERIERQGVIREVEVNVVMNPANVEELIKLLSRMVAEVHAARRKIEQAEAGETGLETEVEGAK
jgi:hypothetical protein